MGRFYAHSANASGAWHELREHLSAVGELAAGFLPSPILSEEARLAGRLHDLGKYGDLFQARLRGEESGLDHWSVGARLALELHSATAALAIEGHHIGLQSMSLQALLRLPSPCVPGLRSAAMPDTVRARLTEDRIAVAAVRESILGRQVAPAVASMLEVRLLFSALVDADYLDTEAHFTGDASGKCYRAVGSQLDAPAALEAVLRSIEQTRAGSSASAAVRTVRDSLLEACLTSADNPPGLFTLTAPTGSGKTLAMLAFALQHALRHGLQRVVIVIPYLSIIEQTASIYRSILEPAFGPEFVLEHHSLTGFGEERSRQDNEGTAAQSGFAERRRKLLAENWDAPIIVTTSVQMLESLFSHRPAACRKLHRLQQAVILFDEVQTLPASLAVPTLAALSHLSAAWRTSVVFATATQPAFTHLSHAVERTSAPAWRPTEVVPEPGQLFAPMRRVNVEWRNPDVQTSWTEIAAEMPSTRSALCIVNLKRHARMLWESLAQDNALHLTTNMCPSHRRDVLCEVRHRLTSGESVRLVATQCVEAGVDLDFPFALRAWGPLDAIIQAAGRCNREGRQPKPGSLVVFQPEDDAYPGTAYEQATRVAQMLYRERGPEAMLLDDPAFINDYYRRLYDIAGTERSQSAEAILEAIRCGSFPEVARLYRIISQDAINVVVPYREQQALFDELVAEAQSQGLSRSWIRRARQLTVSIYRPRPDDPIWDALVPVAARGRPRQGDDDWYIYAVPEHYHPALGLVPPGKLNIWIG